MIIIGSMHQESLIDHKRQEYRIEIRKKQLQGYFEKRRFQILLQEHHPSSYGNSDEEQCMLVASRITQFPITDLRKIMASIITMDASLSTFYNLTRFNPSSPPAYFTAIIAETLEVECQSNTYLQFYLDKEYTFEQKGKLQEIWREMQRLWKGVSQQYINILAEMKRIESIDLLIRQDFISFLSIVLSVLLVFKRMADILSINLEQPTLVGTDVLFRYEINTTLSLLHNMLSGNEQLLVPYIDGFLEMNGCSFESEGLFYNLFLIENVPSSTKIKIFQYYLNILQNERGQVLENYQSVINTLYPALSSSRLFISPQRQELQVICQRIIRFLGDLLTVINMRFQSFTFSFVQENSKQFLHRMGWLLVHLGTNCKMIDRIMEVRSINTFMLNHLSFTSVDDELKVVEYCLRVLCAAATNPYSIHYFLNQQPRFMIKVNHIFQRYHQTNLNTVSTQSLQTLNALICLFCGLIKIHKAAQLLLNTGVLHKITVIYFLLNHRLQSEKNIIYSCEILYIDLLNYIKERSNGIQVFYDCLFKEGTYKMLVEMLKNSERIHIICTSLSFLSFIAYNCREVTHYPQVLQMLRSEKVASILFELENGQDESLSEKAQYISRLIKNLHPPRTLPYDPSDVIEEELQAI